ncbi:MAG: class I tRNA ligase family protein, partial [Acidimicrobiales bacterium]
VPDTAPQVDRAAHRLVARVSDEYERWSYNTAVAALMEFANLLQRDGTTDFAVDALLLLLAPMAPHITAELWERRRGAGGDASHVHAQPWPVADPALARADSVTMVVQVNGKVKDRIEVDPDISEAAAEAAALASAAIKDALAGASPVRVIARPPRLVNLVLRRT